MQPKPLAEGAHAVLGAGESGERDRRNGACAAERAQLPEQAVAVELGIPISVSSTAGCS
jgi:hypothetical protein